MPVIELKSSRVRFKLPVKLVEALCRVHLFDGVPTNMCACSILLPAVRSRGKVSGGCKRSLGGRIFFVRMAKLKLCRRMIRGIEFGI